MTDAEKFVKDLEETRAVTVGELMDMRAALDKAFEDKIGKEPDSGFNIEINSNWEYRVNMWGGYEALDGHKGAVVASTDCFHNTPREVFDFCIEKIKSYHVKTKDDQIKELQQKIEALEADG